MAVHPMQFALERHETEAYQACGRLALSWGPLEHSIEMAIIHLRNDQKYPGNGRHYTDFPVSFSKKCIELKESLKGEAMLAHVRPTVVSVISKAKPLHAIRTIIVHGQFEGTSLKGVLTFRISDQKRGFAGVSKRFSFDAINDASARIAALHAEMSAVTSEVWRTCAEYNAKISKAAS